MKKNLLRIAVCLLSSIILTCYILKKNKNIFFSKISANIVLDNVANFDSEDVYFYRINSSDIRKLIRNSNFGFKNSKFFKGLELVIPQDLYDNVSEIDLKIGGDSYSVSNSKIDNFFLVRQNGSDKLLLLKTDKLSLNKSNLPIVRDSINYKGDIFFLGLVTLLLLSNFFFFFFFLNKNKSIIFKKFTAYILRIEKNLTLKFIKNFLIFIAVLILLIVIFGFFSNFDLTDEGYFLYLNQNGLNEIQGNLTFYHFFSHSLGYIFGHTLLGYRFCTLLLIIIVGLLFAYSIIKFTFQRQIDNHTSVIIYCFIMIAALHYFIFFAVMDYNTYAVLSSGFWASSFLLYYSSTSNSYRYLWVFLLGVSIFLSISSRLSFGIILLTASIFIFIIFIPRRKLKDLFIILIINVFLGFGLYSYLTPEAISEYKEWLSFFSSNKLFTDENNSEIVYMLKFYIKQLYSLLSNQMFYYLLGLFFFIILKQFELKNTANEDEKIARLYAIKVLFILIFLIIFFIKVVILFLSGNINHFYGWYNSLEIYSIFIILIFYSIYINRKSFFDKKNIFLIIIIAAGLTHPAGTSANIFVNQTYTLFLPAGLLIYLLFTTGNGFEDKKLLLLFFLVLFSLHVGFNLAFENIIHARRNGSYANQTDYSLYSPYLKGIKIEKQFAEHIDNMIQLFKKIEFNYEADRIIAYGDVPGLLAAVGVKAYGEPWLSIELVEVMNLTNSFMRTKKAIELEEADKIRNIYILNTNLKPLPEDLRIFFEEKLERNRNVTKQYKIGKGTYYWFKGPVEYDISIEGPFSLK